MDTYCRFVGCVAFGESRPFKTAEGERQVILCSGHAQHVYEAHHNPEKRVEYDEQSGRIRVVPAPPIHDHEPDHTTVRGLLDSAVNAALRPHVLEPGGMADGYIGFYCRRCRKAYGQDEAIKHLRDAVDAALIRK
jgi:hypothetical protein